jgi:hypothetical protein
MEERQRGKKLGVDHRMARGHEMPCDFCRFATRGRRLLSARRSTRENL